MNDKLLQRPRVAPGCNDVSDIDLPRSATRWLMAVIATSLAAGILMAAVLPAWIGADHGAPSRSAKSVGISAAQSGDRMPVYELPPVFVVADRKAELAKIIREEQPELINRAARSKFASKPPA